ncbi:MAG: DbpA RNA binding domain-containing protein, partial [Muricauda sp.]|nr:DbpA RNA binding domain-containing protein [Allomuricauda sp.]
RGNRVDADHADIPSEGSVRYFINIGERDGYDWMSLKDFLRDTLNLEKEDIFNVDTKDSFSFFNTDASITEFILQTFTDFKVDGRFVNVEVSKNPGGSKGGRKRSGRKGGGRKSGGRKGGESKSFRGGKKGGFSKKGGKKRPGFY